MCEFVRLVKGANYIQEVQELTRKAQPSDNPIIPITIEEAMSTEPLKLALDMGIDDNILRNKVQQKMMRTGRPYKAIDELLKAIFDEEENINCDYENTLQSSTVIRQTGNLNISIAVTNGINCYNSTRNDSSRENVLRACSSTSTTTTSIQAIDVINSSENDKVNSNQIEKYSPRSETSRKLTSDRKYLEEENRKLKDARLCKVCLDEEVGVVYLPCGHLVTCVQCAPGVNQCPMCRTKIKGFVRTYLS